MRLVVVVWMAFGAAAVARAGDVIVTYDLPVGADGPAIASRILAENPGLRGPVRAAAGLGDQVLCYLAEDADLPLERLDAVVRDVYRAWWKAERAALPGRIEKLRATVSAAGKRVAAERERLSSLLDSGGAVLDRERALAASAERAEELRRRIVDARIEGAVLEARLRTLRERASVREVRLRVELERRIDELRSRVSAAGLSPNHPQARATEADVEKMRREFSADSDETMRGLQQTLADLEVDKIATEERIEALTKAHEEERLRARRLLRMVDLAEEQVVRVAPVEAALEKAREELRRLEEEKARPATAEPPSLPRRSPGPPR